MLFIKELIQEIKEEVRNSICCILFKSVIVDKCLDLMEKENISKEVALDLLNISLTTQQRKDILILIDKESWSS